MDDTGSLSDLRKCHYKQAGREFRVAGTHLARSSYSPPFDDWQLPNRLQDLQPCMLCWWQIRRKRHLEMKGRSEQPEKEAYIADHLSTSPTFIDRDDKVFTHAVVPIFAGGDLMHSVQEIENRLARAEKLAVRRHGKWSWPGQGKGCEYCCLLRSSLVASTALRRASSPLRRGSCFV